MINSAGGFIPELAMICYDIVKAIKLPVAVNMYLTNRGQKTSAPPHTDKQDVFVLQTSGYKHWKVYKPPMQQSRSFLTSMKPYLSTKIPILSVSKGVEQNTFALMNDIISETLGIDQRAAFLSGPSFAREIMNGQATAVVIASEDANLSKELAVMLSSVEFRCHTSRDVKVNNI